MTDWRPRLRLYWSSDHGVKNSVELGKGARLLGYVEMRGRNNRIVLGEDVHFSGKIYVKGSNQTLTIGAGSTLRRAFIVLQENCDITIGERCVFSRDVEIRTTDAHAVVDAKTRRRVNPAASVTIGDHVWVGDRAFISKGAVIGSDTVVAATAFVSGQFPDGGVVLEGVPAEIVQHAITWRINGSGSVAVAP